MRRVDRAERLAARALALKDYRAALLHLSDLCDAPGPPAGALHAMAVCHHRLGEDERARVLAERVAAMAPDLAGNHVLLADLRLAAGDEAGARAHVARALALARPRSALAAVLDRLRGSGVAGGVVGVGLEPDREWMGWARNFLARTPG